MKPRGVLIAALLVGCAPPRGGHATEAAAGEGAAGGTRDPGGSGGAGGAKPLCAATGFGAAIDHGLPGDYPVEAFDALGGVGDCASGSAEPSFALVDLDGDLLVDLVVTDNCLQEDVGGQRWLFYRNDGASFGAATSWSLPDYGPEAFEHLSGGGACGGGELKPSYGLVDLDGDGRVELVVSDDCADDAIGRTEWRVHRNQGAGFALEAEVWRLPDYGPEAFEHLAGNGACGGGSLKPAYALLDLNGDEQLDLVVTDDCYTAAVGRSQWLVHENTGAGFTDTASSWGLPDYGPDAFERTSGVGACTGGDLKPAFGLVDLDGDEAVDLVVTDDCVADDVGRARWLVHTHTGTAFAASALDWSLPEYGPEAFEHLSGAGACTGGELKPAYGLLDITGDGHVELVVTDDCVDDGVGRSRWLVHPRSANGFDVGPTGFSLPDYGPEPFEHVAGAGPCDAGELKPTFGLVDLDGEGHLDLVVADVCADASVGHTRWLVHRAVCD